jgi:drug/metabolite transporter (DMT)-like permease
LFVRVASPVLGPLVTSFLRVSVAAAVLLIYLAVIKQPMNLRQNWRAFLGMGLFNAAIPFTLFAIALGRFAPQALVCTDLSVAPSQIIEWFIQIC